MVEFRILGPVQLRVRGVVVDLGAAKIRGLLGILLLSPNSPVSIDLIVDRLWDRPPPNPHKTLQGYVSKLRAALEKAQVATPLVTNHGTYRLQVDVATVDYHRFRDLADKGARSARQGDHDRAITELSAAVELWQGPPLANVNSSWAQRHSEALISQDLLPAHHCLLDSHLQLGHYDQVLANLRPLLGAYETDETLVGLQLRALAKLHGPASVARCFNGFVRKLRDVWGLDPSDRIVQVYRRIVEQAATHRPGARSSDNDAPKRVLPHLLPRDIPNFIGRSEVVRELDLRLAPADGRPTVVSIDGEPGIGKTALAVRWAHANQARFPDGVLYADLNGYASHTPTAPATVLATFLDALGIPVGEKLEDTTSEREALLQQALAGRRILVILDNVRDSAHVLPLLAVTSPCPVIVTSRQKLSGLVYQAGAHSITVPTLLLDDAMALLPLRVGAQRAAQDLRATHDLAALCSGLPLALQIAGEHVAARPDTPLGDLVGHLRDQRRLLDAGGHGDNDSRTLRAVFNWSCAALPAKADTLFQLIGLHPSTSISAAAAAAAAGWSTRDTEDVLDALVGAHLVHQQGIDIYHMHDLLHLHAGDRGHERQSAAAQQAVLTRMADWYLLSAMDAVHQLAPTRKLVPPLPEVTDIVAKTFSGEDDALRWCMRERPRILAIARLAAESGLHHHVWRLIGTFTNVLYRNGDLGEARDVNRLALNSARLVGSREAEAGSLNNVGAIEFVLAEYDDAASHFAQALTIFRELEDEPGQAVSLFNLGNTRLETGVIRKAIELHKLSLGISSRIGDQMGQARVYHRLGEAHQKLDQPELAASYLATALKLRRQVHDTRGEAETLQKLGELSLDAGDNVRAIEFCEEALAGHWRTLDQRKATLALRTLAEAHYRLGNHGGSVARADESATLCQLMGDAKGESRALGLLARAYMAMGEREQAHAAWHRALQLCHEHADPYAAEIEAALRSTGARQDPLPEPRTTPLRSHSA